MTVGGVDLDLEDAGTVVVDECGEVPAHLGDAGRVERFAGQVARAERAGDEFAHEGPVARDARIDRRLRHVVGHEPGQGGGGHDGEHQARAEDDDQQV